MFTYIHVYIQSRCARLGAQVHELVGVAQGRVLHHVVKVGLRPRLSILYCTILYYTILCYAML